MARLVIGARALKQKRYASARQNFMQSVRGPITDLAATLLAAWSLYGSGDAKAAVELIDKLQGADWYALFKDMHAGMILDLAGNRKEAGRRLERAQRLDATALRLVEARGSWLSRNHKRDEALKLFQGFDAQLPRHPLIVTAMERLQQGKSLPPLIDSAQAGAAEVLYGLGAALGRRGGEDLGLVYLQLALYLSPNQPLALLSLADLYEQTKNYQLAIKVYERVPTSSPLKRNAEIQLAVDLDASDRAEEAKTRLGKLVAESPHDLDAIMALGNILRGRKAFAECGEVYGKGIATIAEPQKSNWLIFYFRGICNERAKKWAQAEADLKQALKLFPDQPHVLNYLGYSWIDQGIHLDEGMNMIRRAVEQRPDDGYIVDSLGWAYYRLGNYDEAVKNLERAVELKPDDPTINDHLGDIYWKVGRTLEARFQWAHARDLKPDPDDLEKIKKKLVSGLPEETNSAANAVKPKKPGDGG
jgi:Flp pilus assembly protein TadD